MNTTVLKLGMNMLSKWKGILTNWVKCYFDEGSRQELCINLECLLTIIAHLHENLALDESKSSKLEAHTVEEFILEKYPEFKFENGTVEPTNDEELHIVASLLLFFVCVNSKDVGIKHAMCSKLCMEDQEIIMKFSKSLMDCSPVTYRDVQAAISEACSQEAPPSEARAKVAETPPALRSLHSEVRRLQAALDAERFDRNYLQEELSRTSLKMEKLLKDKEQYKLEIVNLKAKISMCCGEDSETRDPEAVAESSARLTKQLEDLEERLVATQEQLDDLQYERDTYKSKVEELKRERDKWLEISQTETTRAGQLSDELEIERRHVQSLKELVTELRQHNQKNCLDSSQLECDDPDASIHSLHNASVCSEACVNVIEVQLSEERAKVETLKQQIQLLQDQLNEVNQKAESEKLVYEQTVSVKDREISELRDRVNQEIGENNDLKSYYNNEITKLNNEINELEQQLKVNSENTRTVIEGKQIEIQTLQEEKLSLLQSFSDETTKLENIIKELRVDIDTERNQKLKMKEDYEKEMMTLKEKISNRNNELVELQNNISENSEKIEQLHFELRKEKEMKNDIANRHNSEVAQFHEKVKAINKSYKQKSDEAQELQRRLLQNVALFEVLNKEIDDLKMTNTDLTEKCKFLEDSQSSLRAAIEDRERTIEAIQKEFENMNNMYSEEKDELVCALDEKTALINTLSMQFHGEIRYKTELENELTHLHKAKASVLEELSSVNGEMLKLKAEIQEKDRMVYALDLYLKEERHTNLHLKQEFDKMTDDFTKLSEEIVRKEEELKALRDKFESEIESAEKEQRKKDEIIESINNKLSSEIEERNKLQTLITSVNEEKQKLAEDLSQKCTEVMQLRQDYEKLSVVMENDKLRIASLENTLQAETDKYLQLQKEFDSHTSNLLTKLNETEKAFEEVNLKSKSVIEEKESHIEILKKHTEDLESTIDSQRKHIDKVEQAKDDLANRLEEDISCKEKFEKEYQNQCAMLEEIKTQLNKQIALKSEEVASLKQEVQLLFKNLDDKSEEMKSMEAKLVQETINAKETTYLKSNEVKDLNNKLAELNSLNDELELELKKENTAKLQAIEALQRENEQLHFTIEEDNSNHEILIKEKDAVIERLEEHLKATTIQLESIRKDYEDGTLMWENSKIEMRETLKAKENQIEKLKEHINELKISLEHTGSNLLATEKAKEDLTRQINDILTESNESDLRLKEQLITYISKVNNYEMQLVNCERAKNDMKEQLETEKALRDALEIEKKKLIIRNEGLMKELYQEQSAYNSLQVEKKGLLSEKSILTQELMEERSVRQMIEQEKKTIIEEKDIMAQHLLEERTLKNKLLEEKECLTQQLLEEQSVKALTEQEKELLAQRVNELELLKEDLLLEKDELNQKVLQLDQNLIEEMAVKSVLQEEKEKLNRVLNEEKIAKVTVEDEKQKLYDEKQLLQDKLVNVEMIKDTLLHDKEILNIEKDTLIKSLSEEKAARDAMETEKNKVSLSFKELNEKYVNDLSIKQEELNTIAVEFSHLKTDFKKHEDKYAHVNNALNSGLEKLLQNLRKEEFCNEVLQKLIAVDKCENLSVFEKCDLLINAADMLRSELSMRLNLEKALERECTAVTEMREMINAKEMQVLEMQMEVQRLQQEVRERQSELISQTEAHNALIEAKTKYTQQLQTQNQSLTNELNDAKVQLEVKVHSLKEKLIDNENLTDKLKRTYDCQIDNLNVMVTKLTNYLKEKTNELEALRKEKERMRVALDENSKVIKSLEEEIKSQKQNQEKLISDFESERLVLKNMVTVTESVMEDQKDSLHIVITEHLKANEELKEENKTLQELIDKEKKNAESMVQEKVVAIDNILKELAETRNERDTLGKQARLQQEKLNEELKTLNEELNKKVNYIEKVEAKIKDLTDQKEQLLRELQFEKESLHEHIKILNDELNSKEACLEAMESQNNNLTDTLRKLREDITSLELKDHELKIRKDSLEFELLSQIDKLTKVLKGETAKNDKLKSTLQEKLQTKAEIKDKVKVLSDELIDLVKEKNENILKLDEMKAEIESNELRSKEEIDKLRKDNVHLVNIIEENKNVISNLEDLIQHELEQNRQLREDTANEKLNLENRCSLLHEYQIKAEKQLEERDKEIRSLEGCVADIEKLKSRLEVCERDLQDKDAIMLQRTQEKDAVINELRKELAEEKAIRDKLQKDLQEKAAIVYELRQKLEEVKRETDMLEALKKENDELVKAVGQRETLAAVSHDKTSSRKYWGQAEKDLRDRHQVSSSTSDLTHSSMESLKTITDLEKIIHDKNRTITTLQSDITYMKSLMAESENKLLDVSKDLEVTRENCEQLASQLKKMMYQKNEEIAELKKQVSKMSVTENRATQIIKVSAKYQAIILKRIAEIKSNTILKELTNFGNTANCDNELRRSITTGSITMEELENFLETTDRQLKRCAEKQIALQKERDRLTEVNKIHESEIINLKKFLTEVSVSFKTFSSLKELYAQKLSRVVSIQRTVRREILNLDGHITDATMCKLERGYAAVMQDLSECAMNLERWVERSIGRTISAEKIKQAFLVDAERTSLATTSFQNTSLEVQLEELENSFQKLLEDVMRAQKGEGAKDPQAVTVMEVRAEYEDKLNRMKAKMKQLYQEQITVFKEKQKEEIAALERELQKSRNKLEESSRAYEEHIRSLTTELWSVGEKFLMKKDEAEWLRRKQKSGSLMSLQHVHSSGLVPHQEEPPRPSDSHSLRSLPVTNTNNREKRDRGLHMSDEEGEVFDNRWLKELSTPRREPAPAPGQRLSELRWRNSLCPPHLKSSYPAETQFTHALDEEDIKCVGTMASTGKQQRKEVGITAYKKPGPPTPSKQAGRLSATDSELRESLRAEPEPTTRKTSTPSRLRALFRSSRSETVDGTPRSRRLSNIFRKK